MWNHNVFLKIPLICYILKISVSANNGLKKFCTTKHFIAGLSVGLALLAVMVPTMMPFITTNAEGIQSNAIGIVEINSNVKHIDDTLNKLDGTIVKLDEKLDKFNLILCDISAGNHC